LAPRPGLQPGTCGLTERRSHQHIFHMFPSVSNARLGLFFVTSRTWLPPAAFAAPANRPCMPPLDSAHNRGRGHLRLSKMTVANVAFAISPKGNNFRDRRAKVPAVPLRSRTPGCDPLPSLSAAPSTTAMQRLLPVASDGRVHGPGQLAVVRRGGSAEVRNTGVESTADL